MKLQLPSHQPVRMVSETLENVNANEWNIWCARKSGFRSIFTTIVVARA